MCTAINCFILYGSLQIFLEMIMMHCKYVVTMNCNFPAKTV